ncbi:MAG: hypothetical protein A2078_13915 [Nitrospirae bacterium GWC2_57_9]|nr:MAG: hypothetical protein A2078_13915 [Nitrospirae bacterium GWC2_57_9]
MGDPIDQTGQQFQENEKVTEKGQEFEEMFFDHMQFIRRIINKTRCGKLAIINTDRQAVQAESLHFPVKPLDLAVALAYNDTDEKEP